MLFAKTEGRSLTLADWNAQAEKEDEGVDEDSITKVAWSFWKAICHSNVPFTTAFRDLEREVLQVALRLSRGTRRDLARRLHTSERTLYYKMRIHHLG
jgi:DNA-binding NtrC family response regulator